MAGFIYALVERSNPGHIRYVGQTVDHRRLSTHIKEAKYYPHKRTHKLNWIRSVVSAGGQIDLVRLCDCESRDEMNWREREWIKHLGKLGHPLTNSTDGGEGVHSPLPEVRAKISAKAIGRRHSEQSRAKMSESRRGVKRGPMSEAQKEKLRAKALLRTFSPEHRAKIGAASRGRVCSPETRQKLREAQIGQKRRPLSPEHRASVSMALRGRVFSDAHRANIRTALLARRVSQ